MNKKELVDAIATQTAATKKDANAVLTAALTTIMDTVSSGQTVRLNGFGTFKLIHASNNTLDFSPSKHFQQRMCMPHFTNSL